MKKHVPHKFVKDSSHRDESIGEYMSSPVLSVDSDDSVQSVATFMTEKKVGSVLVKTGEEYSGIITETDVTRRLIAQGLNPKETKVKEIMTQPLVSLDVGETVVDANKFMAKNKVRHLVVTDQGKVEGIISVRDLVHYFSNPRLRGS